MASKNRIEFIPYKRKGGDVQACRMDTDFEMLEQKFNAGDYLVQEAPGKFVAEKAEDFEAVFEPTKKTYAKSKKRVPAEDVENQEVAAEDVENQEVASENEVGEAVTVG